MIMATPTVIPDKKDVIKVTGKHRVLLDKPVREHYNDYASRGGQAAFSTFAKYRPSNVRTMMKSNLRQCLCEYCANVDLKLRALGNAFDLINHECLPGLCLKKTFCTMPSSLSN